MPYKLVIGDLAEADLRRIRAYDLRTIIDSMNQYLTASPTVELSRRIVKLEQPAITEFRLRVGDFRVYYNVDELEKTVVVVRVVEKGTKTTAEVTEDASH